MTAVEKFKEIVDSTNEIDGTPVRFLFVGNLACRDPDYPSSLRVEFVLNSRTTLCGSPSGPSLLLLLARIVLKQSFISYCLWYVYRKTFLWTLQRIAIIAQCLM